MKRYTILLVLVICLTILLVSCRQNTPDLRSNRYTQSVVYNNGEETVDEVVWDRHPMVMIDGELYLDTGKESDIAARCGVMDGEITSMVEGSEIPTQDYQSNFSYGYGYQYVDENSIDIYINEKWVRFEKKID